MDNDHLMNDEKFLGDDMNIAGSRVLVAGGAGLIGSHLCEQLAAEHVQEIVVFDRNASLLAESMAIDTRKIRLIDGDITLPGEVKEALQGIDFVFHAASLLTRAAAADLKRGLEVNILGTFYLLQECVSAGVRKVIYSSSVSLYGDPVEIPMTEDHPVNTNSMYGAGKFTSELFFRIFKNAKRLDYVSLRYAIVYGTRQHDRGNLISYMLEAFDRIARGLSPIIYGDGSQSYDYICVEDVARANLLALKSPVTEGVFNIGTGITHTTGEVVQMILDITGSSLNPIYVPQGEQLGPASFVLEVERAKKVLGFRSRISLKEGLRRYFEWRKKGPLSAK